MAVQAPHRGNRATGKSGPSRATGSIRAPDGSRPPGGARRNENRLPAIAVGGLLAVLAAIAAVLITYPLVNSDGSGERAVRVEGASTSSAPEGEDRDLLGAIESPTSSRADDGGQSPPSSGAPTTDGGDGATTPAGPDSTDTTGSPDPPENLNAAILGSSDLSTVPTRPVRPRPTTTRPRPTITTRPPRTTTTTRRPTTTTRPPQTTPTTDILPPVTPPIRPPSTLPNTTSSSSTASSTTTSASSTSEPTTTSEPLPPLPEFLVGPFLGRG